MIKRIKSCRICKSSQLNSLINLGDMSFTGIFPKDPAEKLPSGPLELVKCSNCDLVQLAHSFDLSLLYGQNYGYRSGLNGSMVRHLNDKVKKIVEYVHLKPKDLIIDIGSNDATTLRAYPDIGLDLVGIDPSGAKFQKYYPQDIRLITEFFSAKGLQSVVGNKKARVITSFAMFYDLEDPCGFMREVAEVLASDGIWVFEQSYLKSMIDTTSYDTICHEHLEYYGLKQIAWMARIVGLKILDVEFNNVNGGSFSVTIGHVGSHFTADDRLIDSILEREEKEGLYSLATFELFSKRTVIHRLELKNRLNLIRESGKKIFGYGASTKGNVLLQYCGITTQDLPFIAEVNEDKFGCFTPGTVIPIVSEETVKRMYPDCLLVLPWHFRKSILEREKNYIESGGNFLFPLPQIICVGKALV